MTLNELIKTMSALSGIAMVLIASGWLKTYLKAMILPQTAGSCHIPH